MKSNARKAENPATALMDYYETLFRAFGPQGWWPGRTRLEVVVGAILTQNTAWTNVEKAIRGLKRAGLLNPEGLKKVRVERLAGIIRPAGYFNVKAARLKNFLRFLFKDYGGSLTKLFSRGDGDGDDLRKKILEVNGIGPETADSILLYAARRAEFVIDAYTKRVFSRHGFVEDGVEYGDIKRLFMENLPRDAALFNEYHALIVRVGKVYCRPKKPLCRDCPLKVFLK